MKKHLAVGIGLPLLLLLVLVPGVSAATTCTFTTVDSTILLDDDCTTDATILVPEGVTLDGRGHTITAVDPAGDHFRGAVVQNDGAMAYVTNLGVTASGLANVCDAGADRLRGIMFEGASGNITHTEVTGINQGPSGCQEGNAIEVRNEPFDGTHLGTVTVEVAHNVVDAYQKTGIVANGDVNVSIHHNQVGASATQANLAANGIQLGFGANGVVQHNNGDGNQWLGPSNYAATALLVYAADAADVSQNNVRGNSDVGLYVLADDGTYDNNRIFDDGLDGPHGDYGVFNDGVDNDFTNNKVRGFDTPYYGVTGGNNKTIPGGPHASP